MWNSGRAAITTSSSATWWTSHVWHKLATRFRWVSSTLLGSPVVPLDVGRSAKSDADTGPVGAGAVARSDQNGIVPAALSPIMIVSVIAVSAVTPRSFCPVGPAVVTSHRAPVCRS